MVPPSAWRYRGPEAPGNSQAPKHSPLAVKSRARHWKASLREMRSFRTELITRRRNSSCCRSGDQDVGRGYRTRHGRLTPGTWARVGKADTYHNVRQVGCRRGGVQCPTNCGGRLGVPSGGNQRDPPSLLNTAHLAKEDRTGDVADLLLGIPASSMELGGCPAARQFVTRQGQGQQQTSGQPSNSQSP